MPDPILLLLAFLAAAPASAHAPAPRAPGAHQQVINGMRIWCRVAGPAEGTPVVFLHGGPNPGSHTSPASPAPLQSADRTIYLDQRGSGRSEKH